MLLAEMKPLAYVRIAPGRVFGAWVCLAAVALLWAPVWAAAWQADGMACCYGNLCATHRHSKPNQGASQQAGSQQTPMNCEHGNGLADCAMSCPHETSAPLAAAVIFVVPEPAVLSQPGRNVAAPAEFVATEFVPSFEPPSPPPRASLFSL